MKRRSQPKPKRDWERETLKKMTTLSITESEMQLRLLADKTALEVRLKEVFAWRNMIRRQNKSAAQQSIVVHYDELIKGISIELRHVKAQLQ